MVSTVSTILESRKTKTLLLLMLLGAFFVSNDNNGHQILSPCYHVHAFEVSPVTRQRRSACNAGKTRTATIAPTTALDMTSFSSSPMWNTRNSVGGGRDFYRILGVPKTAKEPEIKQAFRRLVKQYHPGKNIRRSCILTIASFFLASVFRFVVLSLNRRPSLSIALSQKRTLTNTFWSAPIDVTVYLI